MRSGTLCLRLRRRTCRRLLPGLYTSTPLHLYTSTPLHLYTQAKLAFFTMRHRSIHPLVPAAILWPCLCLLPGCSGSAAPAEASAPMSPASYTVTVSLDRPAIIAQEQLTLRLTDVKDSRCPAGTQCVWAGHAAVSLTVDKPGTPSQSVVIGTEAPENMKLPGKATYGPYTLVLSRLDPSPDKDGIPPQRYMAIVQVTRP